MLFYMDVSADSCLEKDQKRNVWSISEMTVLFWVYLCRILIDLSESRNMQNCRVQLGRLARDDYVVIISALTI